MGEIEGAFIWRISRTTYSFFDYNKKIFMVFRTIRSTGANILQSWAIYIRIVIIVGIIIIVIGGPLLPALAKNKYPLCLSII